MCSELTSILFVVSLSLGTWSGENEGCEHR